MRLRWTAAGLLMAEKRFRRIGGHKMRPKLLTALDGGKVKLASSERAAQCDRQYEGEPFKLQLQTGQPPEWDAPL